MKKKLKRISIVVNSHTAYHLQKLTEAMGYDDKDCGRAVDLIVKEFLDVRNRNDKRKV